MSTGDWFVNAFDHFCRGEGGAVAVEKARDAVARAYAYAVESGEIERDTKTLDDEGRHLFNVHVMPHRNRRRGQLMKDGLYLLDALQGDTILGRADPYLRMAYPLGDGTDKTLALWTTRDLESARTERYRNASAASVAASEFDLDFASKFIAELEQRNAAQIGDLPFNAA